MSPRHATALLAGLALLCLSAASAAQSSRIAFTRSTSNSDGTLRASTLYRINADGSGFRQLAPMTAGVYRFSPIWSPHGTYIAYVYGTGPHPHLDVYLMTSTGANRRRLTYGSADHSQPAWRPDGARIAYIAEGTSGACLGVVQSDGTGQHNLFCPPGPAYIDNTPRWSADGRRILISTGYYGQGLDPPYHSRAYSVNARTGAATLLTEQTFDEARVLFFAPSGTHGLYANSAGGGSIDAVDFATDVLTPRTTGYAPLYSHDGSKFAYSQQQFGDAPDFGTWDHVFVMSDDGSSDREVTPVMIDNLVYVAIDWSNNDTRLLLNRTVYAPESPGSGIYVGTPAMRIYNAATSAYTVLPSGGGSDWYQGP